MNEKEISEIRRRWRPDKNSITQVLGCYVNEQREIISEFKQSIGLMGEEETDMYLSLFKRALSGSLSKNLIDICFETNQVADSEEHRLLMALRNSDLKDEDALHKFYQTVIEHFRIESNYVILLACDNYDVPYRGRSLGQLDDASTDVFSYFVCSICPVKKTKPTLSYDIPESNFHQHNGNWVISAPEVGFLFPCFDDRATNIYNVLYYTRNAADNHQNLADALFHTDVPMPAVEQKETFQAVLSNTLSEECSFDVVQGVHEQLAVMVESHKVNKELEPLTVSKHEVKQMLACSGVSDDTIQHFEEKFDEAFGEDLFTNPKNLMDVNQFEVRTPDVVIKVKPERSDLIETRVINGCNYILIQADQDVEVNGVSIQIGKPISNDEHTATEQAVPVSD